MLKDNVDLATFFSAVNRCRGEVFFQSAEDDSMNLKSALCQYLFSCVYLSGGIHPDGKIVCQFPGDSKLLEPFLT